MEPKGILPLSYTLALFSSFILKQGLIKLGRAKVPEAGCEPAILLSQPPKYWDYKHAPPCLVLHILLMKR